MTAPEVREFVLFDWNGTLMDDMERARMASSLVRERWAGLPELNLNIGPVRLAIIEDLANTMPRKLHDWRSAHSVYAALGRNDRYSLPAFGHAGAVHRVGSFSSRNTVAGGVRSRRAAVSCDGVLPPPRRLL